MRLTRQETSILHFSTFKGDEEDLADCIENRNIFNGFPYYKETASEKAVVDLVALKFFGRNLTEADIHRLVDKMLIHDLPKKEFNNINSGPILLLQLQLNIEQALIYCFDEKISSRKFLRSNLQVINYEQSGLHPMVGEIID